MSIFFNKEEYEKSMSEILCDNSKDYEYISLHDDIYALVDYIYGHFNTLGVSKYDYINGQQIITKPVPMTKLIQITTNNIIEKVKASEELESLIYFRTQISEKNDKELYDTLSKLLSDSITVINSCVHYRVKLERSIVSMFFYILKNHFID
jgi:hypothetical protein